MMIHENSLFNISKLNIILSQLQIHPHFHIQGIDRNPSSLQKQQ